MKNILLNHTNGIAATLMQTVESFKSSFDIHRLSDSNYIYEITKNNPAVWQAIADWKEILDWYYSLKHYPDDILNFEEKDIYYYLFSPGASASRVITTHYNLKFPHYCSTGLRHGHSAHILDPSHIFPQKNFKAIYITSHPIEFIISHYLTGAITSGVSPIMSGGNAAANFEFIMSPTAPQFLRNVPNIQNINRFFDRYIDNGIDFFKLKDHIKNWSQQKNIYQVKYENFKKKEKQINQWLNKKPDYPELAWKQRNSKRDFLSPQILKRLQNMYADAIDQYEEIGKNN